jgi:flagellar biosynthesis/type III secretory pathway protein FliH
MFVYHNRLYEKYRRRILPIAVFSYDKIRDEPDNFELGFPFLTVACFRFYKLELRKLSWRNYINSNNPAAAALMSKMGFKKEERVRVKTEIWRMLTRLKLDPARMELIAGFVETYLKLNQEEEKQFAHELENLDTEEAEAIMQITTSWHEKGRQEGMIEGRIEGKIEGRIEIICNLLNGKFGLNTTTIQERLQEIKDIDALDKTLSGLFTVGSPEEAQEIIGKALNQTQA